MALYRIFRLKESERQRFRSLPHTAGASVVKPNHYEETGTTEAPSVYSAWTLLKETETPLEVGDLLVDPAGEIQICKFIGFEPARWFVPEQKPAEQSSELADATA